MFDLDFMLDTLRAAGQVALDHFLQVTPTWKENLTYVTEADLAVQEYLRKALETHYPDDGFVAEENDLRKPPRTGSRFWVVDPIDGTAAFSAGLPIWAISVALVDGGEPVAGFCSMPTVDDMIYTGTDGRVYRNGQPKTMGDPAPVHRETSLFIASRLHRYYTVSPDYPGKLRNLGSTMAHLSYLAVGSGQAALVERVYIWDIAAGLAMLRANGGTMAYLPHDAERDPEAPLAPVALAPLLGGDKIPYPMLAGYPETIATFARLITYQGGE